MSRRYGDPVRRAAAFFLVFVGILMVFVCLPMQFLLILLGIALSAAGFLLLR